VRTGTPAAAGAKETACKASTPPGVAASRADSGVPAKRFEQLAELRLEGRELGGAGGWLQMDDEIDGGQGGSRRMPAEDVAHPPLGAVAHHRGADFARGGDPQPGMAEEIGQGVQHEERARAAPAAPITAQEIAPLTQSIAPAKALGAHDRGPGRSDSQALAPLGAAARQHGAPVLGGHALAKAVGALTSAVVGLESALHDRIPLWLIESGP